MNRSIRRLWAQLRQRFVKPVIVKQRNAHPPRDVQIMRFSIPKAKLAVLSPEVRYGLLVAGHIANEINTLARVSLFSLKAKNIPVLDRIAIGRAWVALRALIGKLAEGYETIQKRIQSPPFRTYLLALLAQPEYQSGRQALDELNKYFGAGGLLHGIRNRHAFHNPEPELLESAFQEIADDDDWSIYTAEARNTGFFAISEMVALRAMLAEIGPDPAVAVGRLADEAIHISDVMSTFLEMLIIGVLRQANAVESLSPALMIRNAPSTRDFVIPPITS